MFFDLITIRFLLRYLSRPLHFFGTFGMISIFSGSAVSLWLLMQKFLHHTPVMFEPRSADYFCRGVIAGGIESLAVGLLGEMQVRHYHEPSPRALFG